VSKSTVTGLSITATGDGITTFAYQDQFSGTGGFAAQSVALIAGANTITPPSWALRATIVPASGSSNAKTLKGVSGDTGIPLATAESTKIALSSASSFVINSTGSETITVYWT
jgi:hypothetical protein